MSYQVEDGVSTRLTGDRRGQNTGNVKTTAHRYDQADPEQQPHPKMKRLMKRLSRERWAVETTQTTAE